MQGIRESVAGGTWAHPQGRRGDIAATGGSAGELFVECRGEHEAAGDAAEDGGEIGAAEGFGEEGKGGGAGVLAELVRLFLAKGDKPAQQAEEAPDAAATLRLLGRGVGVGGLGGACWRGGHERNKNISARALSRKKFLG